MLFALSLPLAADPSNWQQLSHSTRRSNNVRTTLRVTSTWLSVFNRSFARGFARWISRKATPVNECLNNVRSTKLAMACVIIICINELNAHNIWNKLNVVFVSLHHFFD